MRTRSPIVYISRHYIRNILLNPTHCTPIYIFCVDYDSSSRVEFVKNIFEHVNIVALKNDYCEQPFRINIALFSASSWSSKQIMALFTDMIVKLNLKFDIHPDLEEAWEDPPENIVTGEVNYYDKILSIHVERSIWWHYNIKIRLRTKKARVVSSLNIILDDHSSPLANPKRYSKFETDSAFSIDVNCFDEDDVKTVAELLENELVL